MVKKLPSYMKINSKLIEEFNQNISFPTEEISLKTNKELMEIYIQSLLKTMEGGDLNGMKIILDMLWISYNLRKKFLKILALR